MPAQMRRITDLPIVDVLVAMLILDAHCPIYPLSGLLAYSELLTQAL